MIRLPWGLPPAIRWRMLASLTPSPARGKAQKLIEEVRDLMPLRPSHCKCSRMTGRSCFTSAGLKLVPFGQA